MGQGRSGIFCKAHCASCGSHFRSTTAFDLHRAGSHRQGTRHCLDPDDVGGLVLRTDSGRCEIYPDRLMDGVLIWRTPETDFTASR
jgi:hypothetical protein